MDNQVTWFEKYRPSKLSDYVCDEQSKKRYEHLIKTNLNQHLLFGGDAGTGKTTLSEIICKTIDCDYITINGSDETSVDDIRGKVKSFISTTSFTGSGLKVIIYDEMEYLSKNGQAMLRKYMEDYVHRSRFILCCNELDKVIAPIKSRCSNIFLKSPTSKMVKERLKFILESEDVKYSESDLNDYINVFYVPDKDFRRVINELQSNSIDNELLATEKHIYPEYQRFYELFSKMDFDVQYDWKLEQSELIELKNLQKLNGFLIKTIK